MGGDQAKAFTKGVDGVRGRLTPRPAVLDGEGTSYAAWGSASAMTSRISFSSSDSRLSRASASASSLGR